MEFAINRPPGLMTPTNQSGELHRGLSVAALNNAIFDATGARLRQVPFTPERVKRALG
jgi:nicotinate dehydrogenase subunit B